MVIDTQEPLLTVGEVAQLLNIHSNTVRRWSDRGMITTYRTRGRGDRMFKREDIVRFLARFDAAGAISSLQTQDLTGVK